MDNDENGPRSTDSNELDSFQTSATYRALANSLPLSLLIKSHEGRRIFANEAYLRWRSLQWDEVIGKTDRELFPEPIAAQYIADDRHVMQTGQSTHAVEKTRVADGSAGWVERVKSPIRDAQGRMIGVQVLFWDVTARIVAEQAIKFEQSLLTTLLQSIPDSIYFKDTESRFIRVSQAMANKFGHADSSEVQGRSDADIFTPDHARQARDDEIHIIETGRPLVDRIERETWPDGDDTWCLTTKMPLQDSDGKIIGTFGISRDITALKQSEAALKEAVRMADAANRAKSEFLANMSHEIRTPMNAMVGMADLLAQTDLDETQRDYVDTIRRSSDSLLRLLNDILDFSKIEARRLELEAVPFSLGYEVQAALSTLRLQASEKNLKLRFEQDEGVPSHFIGDPGRLRQVLVNLIGNAVKFTDVGEVKVRLQHRGRNVGKGSASVRVSVCDTGIGIPPNQQAAVLAPFTQADASMTRRFGGTGLGLSISRQLVELMGGSLRLESESGVGTTFFFDLELPITEVPELIKRDGDREDDLGPAADIELTPLRVLVAEDGITNQHVIAGLLRSLGHECSIASDGRETLVKWKNERFDLILMDMHMPVMDGLEATEAIRQQEIGTEHRIPIIALTAAAMAEDAKACRSAGMDDYLTKPIHRRRLQQILNKYSEPVRAHENSSRMAPTSAAGTNPTGTSFQSSDDLTLSAAHAGCLDLESARSRIPGGVSGVMRLATVFRGECESVVGQLVENLGLGENDTARRNAHTLKGACGLLGAKQLQRVATEIETAGREERLSEKVEAQRLLALLQKESCRVIAAIDELLKP